MGKYAYLNGRYVHHRDGYVHFDDRGYQFGDGIYEATMYMNGIPYDAEGHWSRMERSLQEMEIPMPFSRKVFQSHVDRLVRKNRLKNGLVYVQITRGVAPRNHPIPDKPLRPSILIYTIQMNITQHPKLKEGVSVISVPDNRHARRDIKTLNLLANCLARTQASRAGCYEAIQIEDGYITEGCGSNFWIIKDGVLITHPVAFNILCGITRQAVKHIAELRQITVEERPFTLEEAYDADEAFVTSAGDPMTSVVSIDGRPIGKGALAGKPGAICRDLIEDIWAYSRDVSRQDSKFVAAQKSRADLLASQA